MSFTLTIGGIYCSFNCNISRYKSNTRIVNLLVSYEFYPYHRWYLLFLQL
nr:MAG TPA: aurone synthase oxidase [Bacteriophage sp.]